MILLVTQMVGHDLFANVKLNKVANNLLKVFVLIVLMSVMLTMLIRLSRWFQ